MFFTISLEHPQSDETKGGSANVQESKCLQKLLDRDFLSGESYYIYNIPILNMYKYVYIYMYMYMYKYGIHSHMQKIILDDSLDGDDQLSHS